MEQWQKVPGGPDGTLNLLDVRVLAWGLMRGGRSCEKVSSAPHVVSPLRLAHVVRPVRLARRCPDRGSGTSLGLALWPSAWQRGKSNPALLPPALAQAFYSDPKRYAYTFQNYVFLTRMMQAR